MIFGLYRLLNISRILYELFIGSLRIKLTGIERLFKIKMS